MQSYRLLNDKLVKYPDNDDDDETKTQDIETTTRCLKRISFLQVQYCYLCFREFTMPTRFEQHMELHKKRMENLFEESPCPYDGCDMSFPDRIR